MVILPCEDNNFLKPLQEIKSYNEQQLGSTNGFKGFFNPSRSKAAHLVFRYIIHSVILQASAISSSRAAKIQKHIDYLVYSFEKSDNCGNILWAAIRELLNTILA
jgi:hypothetical protein